MPRTIRRREQQVVIPSNSLVASATRYPGKAARIYQPRQDWQNECYRHYSICGEARFAANFFGHAVSRAVLGTAVMEGNTAVKTVEGPAFDKLQELFSGKDGQTQMLNSIGIHLTIAGECYLVGRQVDGGDVWEVVSCIEMVVAGNTWQINYGDGLPAVTLTENDVVIRIWTPSPARRIEADSPYRALLPILGEIEWLTRHVFAQITSRLASAGILFLPQGMTFPPPPENADLPETANEASTFMATLGDAMMTPLSDPGSPSSVIPIVVTAPDTSIDKARLLTFWSELDSETKDLRAEAIRRFALGMDLPPEQILGMAARGTEGGSAGSGVSHWGAWQVEESTIKLHIEPMLDVIVNAITMGYLRPALGDGAPLVVFDSSALRLRPDRSKEAFELYDRGLLGANALLRENGFSLDDLPQVEEFKAWLLRKMATGSTTPEQVAEAAKQLGVDLGNATVPTGQPRQERPAPSLDEHPTKPRTPAETSSLLLAASEPLVYRALERAGNRLRSSGSRPPGAPAYETHVYVKANGTIDTCLLDAWSCAPMTLQGIVDDPVAVIDVLNAYCQSLLVEQVPHTRERLSHWLSLMEVAS